MPNAEYAVHSAAHVYIAGLRLVMGGVAHNVVQLVAGASALDTHRACVRTNVLHLSELAAQSVQLLRFPGCEQFVAQSVWQVVQFTVYVMSQGYACAASWALRPPAPPKHVAGLATLYTSRLVPISICQHICSSLPAIAVVPSDNYTSTS
jgi:hypothetical protein